MNWIFRTILKLFVLSFLAGGTVACHSSRKTVKGSAVIPARKIDYKEMRDEVNSRDYDVPMIGELISEAARWLGVPYRYAGNDKGGVDCSGLTSQVFLKTLNVKMPRSSREQQQWCKSIDKDNLKPGDLVFFATGSDRNRVSHVGIYIGNGDIIHASSSRGVVVSNLAETYYMMRYHSSGRPEVISQLYASAPKKRGKNKSKSSKSQSQSESHGLDYYPSPTPPPTSSPLPEITIDTLIEQQVDSIANAITEKPILPSPQISPVEPSDTILTQFFD